jgi:hypothetical protein
MMYGGYAGAFESALLGCPHIRLTACSVLRRNAWGDYVEINARRGYATGRSVTVLFRQQIVSVEPIRGPRRLDQQMDLATMTGLRSSCRLLVLVKEACYASYGSTSLPILIGACE